MLTTHNKQVHSLAAWVWVECLGKGLLACILATEVYCRCRLSMAHHSTQVLITSMH